MIFKAWILLGGMSCFLFAEENLSFCVRKVEAAILLGESDTALECIEHIKEHYGIGSEDAAIFRLQMRALALKKDSGLLWQLWRKAARNMQNELDILEEVAWVHLHEGMQSGNVLQIQEAITAAAATQHKNAVPILLEGLRSPFIEVRLHVLTQIGHYPDDSIRHEILHMLRYERHPGVRLALLQAIALLKMSEATEDLYAILLSEKAHATEKVRALLAFLEVCGPVSEKRLDALLSEKNCTLAMLGCELVMRLCKQESLPVVARFLESKNKDLVLEALRTFAFFLPTTWNGAPLEDWGTLQKLAKDPLPEIALSVARVYLIQGIVAGEALFLQYINSPCVDHRRMAVALLSVSGRNAIPLLRKFVLDGDLCVRLTAMRALLAHDVDVESFRLSLCRTLQDSWGEFILWVPSLPGIFSFVPYQGSLYSRWDMAPEPLDAIARFSLFTVLVEKQSADSLSFMHYFLSHERLVFPTLVKLLQMMPRDEVESIASKVAQSKQSVVALQGMLAQCFFREEESAWLKLQKLYYTLDKSKKAAVLGACMEARGRDSEIWRSFFLKEMQHGGRVLQIRAAGAFICSVH